MTGLVVTALQGFGFGSNATTVAAAAVPTAVATSCAVYSASVPAAAGTCIAGTCAAASSVPAVSAAGPLSLVAAGAPATAAAAGAAPAAAAAGSLWLHPDEAALIAMHPPALAVAAAAGSTVAKVAYGFWALSCWQQFVITTVVTLALGAAVFRSDTALGVETRLHTSESISAIMDPSGYLDKIRDWGCHDNSSSLVLYDASLNGTPFHDCNVSSLSSYTPEQVKSWWLRCRCRRTVWQTRLAMVSCLVSPRCIATHVHDAAKVACWVAAQLIGQCLLAGFLVYQVLFSALFLLQISWDFVRSKTAAAASIAHDEVWLRWKGDKRHRFGRKRKEVAVQRNDFFLKNADDGWLRAAPILAIVLLISLHLVLFLGFVLLAFLRFVASFTLVNLVGGTRSWFWSSFVNFVTSCADTIAATLRAPVHDTAMHETTLVENYLRSIDQQFKAARQRFLDNDPGVFTDGTPRAVGAKTAF
jgi:hypothetical protein